MRVHYYRLRVHYYRLRMVILQASLCIPCKEGSQQPQQGQTQCVPAGSPVRGLPPDVPKWYLVTEAQKLLMRFLEGCEGGSGWWRVRECRATQGVLALVSLVLLLCVLLVLQATCLHRSKSGAHGHHRCTRDARNAKRDNEKDEESRFLRKLEHIKRFAQKAEEVLQERLRVEAKMRQPEMHTWM